ncbi:iron chaperone [Roseivirga sp.]|uniref:iron chaperone n=1 Tax=Roseivirga sp. TaxID=1964215 RepID=UPI003B8EA0FF
MQYDVKDPAAYIKALEPDWRKDKLLELREIIKGSLPELKEDINYKMLCYSNSKGEIFHLNAQKNYVSLYVGDAAKIDSTGELLKGIDVGKGCIRFKKSVQINETRIKEFIVKTVDLRNKNVDIGC